MKYRVTQSTLANIGARTQISIHAGETIEIDGALEPIQEPREIEKLEYVEVKCDTATFGKALRAPDIDEVVEKLNQVIDTLNTLQKEKSC